MDRNSEVRKAFGDYIEEYDQFMMDTRHTKARNKLLSKLYPEIRGKVLDVATGTGEVAINLMKNKDVIEVHGIDFSEKMINEAIKKAKKEQLDIKFSVQSADKLDYPDNFFNTVICCLAVCWFTDRKNVLNEMKRVCKSNGKIILLEERGVPVGIKKVAEGSYTQEDSEALQKLDKLEEYLSPEDIKNLMNEIGCKLVKETEVISIDENHGILGMIFEK